MFQTIAITVLIVAAIFVYYKFYFLPEQKMRKGQGVRSGFEPRQHFGLILSDINGSTNFTQLDYCQEAIIWFERCFGEAAPIDKAMRDELTQILWVTYEEKYAKLMAAEGKKFDVTKWASV